MNKENATPSRIEAVIFDMDGLLIDSEPFWQRAEQEVFSQVGLHLTSAECLQTKGLRIDEVVEYWFQRRPWTPKPNETLADDIVARVKELVVDSGIPKPGAIQALEFVASKNLPRGLASGSMFALIEAVLKRLGLENYFDVVHSAEMESRGKPAPDVYLTACRKLGVSPAHTLTFEDSPNGIRAAKAAGMICVAVPEEEISGELRGLSDLVLDSLEEFGENEWRQLGGL